MDRIRELTFLQTGEASVSTTKERILIVKLFHMFPTLRSRVPYFPKPLLFEVRSI